MFKSYLPLPDCSSFTVFVIAEPVRAANVAEWEARKRDIRLRRSSFKHLEDSPSLRVRITLSCKMSATHNAVCVCAIKRIQKWTDVFMFHLNRCNDHIKCGAHRKVKDIHEDRVASLCLLVQTCRRPDPVQISSVWAEVQCGHAAAHREVLRWHGYNLAHLNITNTKKCVFLSTLHHIFFMRNH